MYFISTITLFIVSCSTGYDRHTQNFIDPSIELKIESVYEYEKNLKDLRTCQHNIMDDINICKNKVNPVEEYFKHVTYNGERILRIPNECDYLVKAKIIGNNDYVLKIDNIYKIEKKMDYLPAGQRVFRI